MSIVLQFLKHWFQSTQPVNILNPVIPVMFKLLILVLCCEVVFGAVCVPPFKPESDFWHVVDSTNENIEALKDESAHDLYRNLINEKMYFILSSEILASSQPVCDGTDYRIQLSMNETNCEKNVPVNKTSTCKPLPNGIKYSCLVEIYIKDDEEKPKLLQGQCNKANSTTT